MGYMSKGNDRSGATNWGAGMKLFFTIVGAAVVSLFVVFYTLAFLAGATTDPVLLLIAGSLIIGAVLISWRRRRNRV